jgi:HD-GYP domain-containing protein (c-di-GMP phosphodiesterase class II)
VSELCGIIARDMGLDDRLVETAEVAGALLNLGKVMVPREILTRTGALSPTELDDIRLSRRKSADLLANLTFNGPVVETLREANAHWDGSGLPVGLKGEEILVTARILMVANVFVGMISARAHRDPLPIERVIGLLQARAGEIYDRRPVAALVNYLENQGGRTLWEQRAAETSDSVDDDRV